MIQSFKHSAESLQDFFSQSGRGFYVPYYQRNYSWDDENATKLVNDVFSGIDRAFRHTNNTIFLGTIILHDEKNIAVGTHTDTPNLITKVSNVVDGQQRITSLAMLAAVLSHWISKSAASLERLGAGVVEFATLATELKDQLPDLQEFYSVRINRAGVQPPTKPIIIRAGDVTANPVSDQWTLKGDPATFYRSNTSHFLSDIIGGVSLSSIQTDERIEGVISAFSDRIGDKLGSADLGLATSLLTANSETDGSLYKFLSYPPNLQNVLGLSVEAQEAFYGAMFLLAVCAFLKNCCHLVVIESKDENLAFDMFQSLNATGTPLTAFEVFKPMIVRLWGSTYASTIKSQVDRIEKVFETKSTAGEKEDLTDRVIASSALVYNGQSISTRFSEERNWLFEALPSSVNMQASGLVTCIADQSEYCAAFVLPKRPAKNETNFGLVVRLQTLGLNPADADLAALCIYYLRDARHDFAHTVISIFYSKLLRAQGNPTSVAAAANEFLGACKATAAFFTLWMGATRGRFPDSEYRSLLDAKASNMTILAGAANQTTAFLKPAFRTALASQNIYDAINVTASRTQWVDQAKQTAWYSRKAVCRFALLVAAHDALTDLSPGNEGLFVSGQPQSANLLNCRSWYSKNYEVIEHVATRKKPSNIRFQQFSDPTVYPGNNSVVDKLGNLTLLSTEVNSSVYSEWPDKIFYFWNLTTPTSTSSGPAGSALMAKLGLASLPPALQSLSAATSYLSHLAPLAYRGQQGLLWDASFIEKRSEHLCGRVFDLLDPWLR